MNAFSAAGSYRNKRSEISLVSTVGDYSAAVLLVREREFSKLVLNWIVETSIFSDPYDIINNRHFKRIVSLGQPAIGLIIAEISANPSLLSEALKEITGEYPVQESSFGDLQAMANDWRKWWNLKRHAG
ncbi:MAG: hypothetical protein ACRYHQ_28320 [Janthinobacterium lividum]